MVLRYVLGRDLLRLGFRHGAPGLSMRRTIALVMAFCVLYSSCASAWIIPVVAAGARVALAMSSAIRTTMVARGFTLASDTRVASTIAGVFNSAKTMSSSATAGAGAWTGFMQKAAGWLAGATGLAIGASLAKDQAWTFSSNGTVVTATAPPAVTGLGGGLSAGQVAYWSDNYGCSGLHATPEAAALEVLKCAFGSSQVTSVSSITLTLSSTPPNRWLATMTGIYQGQTIGLTGYSVVYITQTTASQTCPAGKHQSGSSCVSDSYQASWYQPVAQSQTQPSAAAAVAALPTDKKSDMLSDAMLARIINAAWQAAASSTASVVPYSAARPVTAEDVAAARAAVVAAQPTSWPTIADLAQPIPASNVDPADMSNAVPTADSTATKVDLGVDPGIATPTLDDAPTDLFKPIRDLLDPWLSWQVPAHSGECPTWSAAPSIAGHVFAIEVSSHCSIAESYRSVIESSSMVVWLVIAAFIVLSA